MKTYYNENDPFAAAWLRELIGAGLIAHGDVDEQSICDARPDDLAGYEQCHFFAGIGGWPYALQLAGWRGPVWTGSCPCQPLSSAGQRKGHADKRHLWPAFYVLISKCRPATIFGEQVASKDGREWLAGVRADLEALGYAVGAADLCAAGVGAPHIRQRLFWVADAGRPSDEFGREFGNFRGSAEDIEGQAWQRQRRGSASTDCSATGRIASTWNEPGNAQNDWLHCLDGKARRTQSGLFPLADGVPARVGRLRGYGNAIVPQLAAEFVSAFIAVSSPVSLCGSLSAGEAE